MRFILCNELVTVFCINLAAPQQCLKQALPLRSACANFPTSAPRVLLPKAPSSEPIAKLSLFPTYTNAGVQF